MIARPFNNLSTRLLTSRILQISLKTIIWEIPSSQMFSTRNNRNLKIPIKLEMLPRLSIRRERTPSIISKGDRESTNIDRISDLPNATLSKKIKISSKTGRILLRKILSISSRETETCVRVNLEWIIATKDRAVWLRTLSSASITWSSMKSKRIFCFKKPKKSNMFAKSRNFKRTSSPTRSSWTSQCSSKCRIRKRELRFSKIILCKSCDRNKKRGRKTQGRFSPSTLTNPLTLRGSKVSIRRTSSK